MIQMIWIGNYLKLIQHNTNDMDCQLWGNVSNNIGYACAQKQKGNARENDTPFMNSTLRKAIMYRSKLRNKFLKTRTEISRKAYVKHRNHCVSLFREENITFYNKCLLKKSGNLFSQTKLHLTITSCWLKTMKLFLTTKNVPK